VRRIRLPGTEIEASRLGFGCASLGSRVSAKAGLEALARAHAAGVTWFDVAPAYGAGEAETILGRFLAGRRQNVQVLTKVGLAPPARAGLVKAAHAALRPVAGALRQVRRHLRAVGATRNTTLAITPALIERSIAASLRALQTDCVDVLSLHDPDPAVVAQDEIRRALEQVLRRGQARHVGVAGSAEACLAGARCGGPYSVFQTAVDPGCDVFASIRQAAGRPIATIGHSVLGVAARDDLAARTLLEAALAQNPDGIILMSMFAPGHLAANLAAEERAARAPLAQTN
jgi:aryl-alcohol dehydrogenase-like predicted oxidoreductase